MALKKSEKTGTNQVELEVFIDAKTFDNACNQVYRRDVKKIVIPGFRAGKAPRKMIEKRYGEKIFFDDAMEIVYPKALEEAIEEAKLDVVGVESLEPLEVSAEKGATLKAVCVTKPEVQIQGYKGMKAQKKVKNVTEKDVTAELERMQQRNARTIQVEDRAAKKDDTVVIDFEGFIDEKPFDGGKAEKYSLKLGSGQFIPGFEEQIEGKKIGEEFDVCVPFPKDYQAKELAGKDSVFHCKLHEIQQVELPALDDEFAKDVSEFDTLEELKKDIKKKMKEGRERASLEEMENELSKGLIGLLKGEIPELMFKQRAREIERDFANRLQSQGISIDVYMQYTGLSREDLQKKFQEQATDQVKLRLALEKIAQIEKLEVSEKEIAEKYQQLGKQYKMEVEKLKTFVPEKEMKTDLLVERAMELVKKEADTTEKKEAAGSKKASSPSAGAKKTASSKGKAAKAKTSNTKGKTK